MHNSALPAALVKLRSNIFINGIAQKKCDATKINFVDRQLRPNS